MVTLMYLALVLLGIKGSSSPLNIFITYSQLCLNSVKIGSGIYLILVCAIKKEFVVEMILTLLGVWNLDFFRLVLPPTCVSSSTKAVNVLLFEYAVALYPFALTALILCTIELHDRNCRVLVYLSTPLKRFCRNNWNAKERVLNACVTFLLLAYSKLLFVSFSLLIAVCSYNCKGEIIPNSTVLLFDPTVKYFHSAHIPYVIIALSIIFMFVILPPLILCLYPTRTFKSCLHFMGLKRSDILHLIMDMFQGWYKDGTENTIDYRPFSALFMLLRIAFPFAVIATLFEAFQHKWIIAGMFHIGLGMVFFTLRPYKKKWMNYTDGLFLYILGTFMVMRFFEKSAIIAGLTMVSVALALPGMYMMYKYTKKIFKF